MLPKFRVRQIGNPGLALVFRYLDGRPVGRPEGNICHLHELVSIKTPVTDKGSRFDRLTPRSRRLPLFASLSHGLPDRKGIAQPLACAVIGIRLGGIEKGFQLFNVRHPLVIQDILVGLDVEDLTDE